jgi:cell division protein FtsQ
VVEIEEDESQALQFVKEEEILDYTHNFGQAQIINQKLDEIDKIAIENRIEKNPFVQNAEVFSNFEGAVKVYVDQKNPIYRVFNNQGVSYYVCENGEIIPISSNFTPRLFVATGYLSNGSEESDSLHLEILELVNFINQDEFWTAMIGQVNVAKNGDIILIPKIGEHQVILGNVDNLDEKFKFLYIFYKEAIQNVDWQQYSTINLKYKGQIICTKK